MLAKTLFKKRFIQSIRPFGATNKLEKFDF